MTPQEIRDAIAASPELQAMVAEGRTGAVAAALSQGLTVMDTETKFTSLGIAERFPALGPLPGPLAAEMVLQKLEGFAAAAAQSEDVATKLLGGATQRQMQHLKTNGMAIGSPAIAAMLAVIVQAGTLTQQEADALVSVATVTSQVTHQQVEAAMEGIN